MAGNLTQKPKKSQKQPDAARTRTIATITVVIALLTAATCTVMVWAEPRPIGDLFVAFASGRDTLAGKIAKPDEWAFTTTGRVWYNQNYGTHLLHYLGYLWGGDWGVLGMKLFFVAASTAFVALAGRQRGASWAAALLAAGGVMAASRSYVDMRPNLTTLTLAPLVLWIFYLSRTRVHVIWVAVVAATLWANAHNGFIFGVCMILLWAGVRSLALLASTRNFLAALRKAWPLLLAAVATLLLANFANPFTIATLRSSAPDARTLSKVFEYIRFPFTILSPAWKKLNEWQPMFPEHPTFFGTIWEFFIVTGILAGLTVMRVLNFLTVGGKLREQLKPEKVGMFLFDAALAATVIKMSYEYRRFIPLAVILLGPLVAMQLDWLGRATRPWVLPAAAVALLIPVGHYAWRQYLLYRPDNPLFPRETVFDRMAGVLYMPTGAAQFIRDNDISGRVLNEWRWEGYLRWICPKVKVFLGGRAHQVYREETDTLVTTILAYPNNAHQVLAGQDVHLVVVPAEDKYSPLIRALLDRQWAQLYFDGRDTIVADAQWPQTLDLLHRCIEGKLLFPNEIAAALSRAACMTAPALKCPPEAMLQAFIQTNRVMPIPVNYRAIWQFHPRSGDRQWVKSYFEQEAVRLWAMEADKADGMRVLYCRKGVADYLAQISQDTMDVSGMMRWQREGQAVQAQMAAMQKKWSLH